MKLKADGTKEWDKTLGTKGFEGFGLGEWYPSFNPALNSLQQTSDGGYILGVRTISSISGDKTQDNLGGSDYWLVKLRADGSKVWDKTIGTFGDDFFVSVQQTSDGNYILGGSSYSSIEGDKSEENKGKPATNGDPTTDYWIIKIKEGKSYTAQWNRRYGGANHDVLTSVIKTSDGGYLAGGFSVSNNSGDKSLVNQGQNDYWIVKSDKNGKKLWDKRYGGSNQDYLNRVIQTLDGGYLLAGSSHSGKSGDKTEANQGQRDYWVVKINARGNKQWDKTFGGSGYDELKKVIQLNSGEYVLGGYSDSPASGSKSQASRGGTDYWLVKISANDTKLWDHCYGGNLDELFGSFTETRDGGLFLGGFSLSGKSGDKSQASYGAGDYWAVKTDKDGHLLWEKSYGGSGQEEAYSVGRSQGANLYLAGTSESGNTGDKSQASQGGKDYWLINLDEQGTKLWDSSFGGSKDDELRASTFTGEGNYLLAGYSYSGVSGDKTQPSQGASDYWVVQVDGNGNKVADQRYGGSGEDELRTIFQTNDGGLLLGGRSNSGVSGDRTQPSQGGTDYWLVKVAPAATPILAAREAILAEEQISSFYPVQVQAYPNPFQDQVTVSFTLPLTQTATVKVYDSQSREVTTLFQEEAKANQTYQVKWRTGNKPAGLYFLQLQTPTRHQQWKLLLTK
ncbi:T9SS type A sorting domain-containing protein [Adhaeribacter radiodurans]|uniref:T9SS type A sorting domain-containing protein n=1 Tax=Adhaeribacter radiodurans TaxID=2745197 RepID=A0A7L7L530_9BACT|nr:T9SS type A sorting domain-containing protein [Adhaeribacter radiodurans]QMU27874.1 T9SS type A sorting domain-containing protein [Adhaeribacter radiodurans]